MKISGEEHDQEPKRELPQQELDIIEEHAIRISGEGESSSANSQKLVSEFTEEERNIIEEQSKIYEGEAIKSQEEAHRGRNSCIFRVLPTLKENNGDLLYEPNKVSIGPYYYKEREEKFKTAEDCKRKCVVSLLRKTKINTYTSCLQRINELKEKIRECYSEESEVTGIEFLRMMFVDACFIIEIIEMFMKPKHEKRKSDLGAFVWMVPYFYKDFLLLENQIPFFVLEEIYALTHDISVQDSGSRLRLAALGFFENGMKRPHFIFGFIVSNTHLRDTVPVLHLLDLVRSSFIPTNIRLGKNYFPDSPFIHCISKLRLAGIKVSSSEAPSLLEVNFKGGVIEMPSIAVDGFMICVLLNCVAFEQCHQNKGKYFSVYATFLDCLVNTKEDVEYLRERNVMDNYLTDDDSKLADFLNRAGKDLVLHDHKGFYLGKLFEDVDRHYRNRWNWKCASFEREYIEKPWYLLSAAGAILLVVATSFQAVTAFLTYKFKNC